MGMKLLDLRVFLSQAVNSSVDTMANPPVILSLQSDDINLRPSVYLKCLVIRVNAVYTNDLSGSVGNTQNAHRRLNL